MESAKFGKYLQKMRNAKDMTQSQLAESLHVSTSAVSKWERGICLPEVTKFENIAEILDVSLLELMRCGEISENKVIIQASETVRYHKDINEPDQGKDYQSSTYFISCDSGVPGLTNRLHVRLTAGQDRIWRI